jgi:hypothetical protein
MSALVTTGSILGMVFGTAGFTISVLNYLRDRPRVKVILQWNMVDPQTNEVKGLVRVTNIGRRPIFICIAALEVPDGVDFILNDSVVGIKLGEGEKPAGFLFNHDGMAKYSNKWREIRAFVVDSTGKRYTSKRPAKDAKPPRWVT